MTTLELIPSTLKGEIIATETGWMNVSTNATEKYKFKSLGKRNHDTYEYEGKFPLDSYLDLFKHSNKYHTIGGKQVMLVGCCMESIKDTFNKYTNPTITVEQAKLSI